MVRLVRLHGESCSGAIGDPRLADGLDSSYLLVKPNFASQLPAALACTLSPITAEIEVPSLCLFPQDVTSSSSR